MIICTKPALTDGGILLQLRNLINRRNVAKDVTGRFNETIDFAELVINCHIVAAGMKFFGLKSVSDEPAYNSSILRAKNEPKEKQWKQMKVVVGRLVDRFVIVERFMDIQPKAPIPRVLSTRDVFENPHALRIQSEHCYCMQYATRVTSEHCYAMYKLPHLHLTRNANFLAGYRVLLIILMQLNPSIQVHQTKYLIMLALS